MKVCTVPIFEWNLERSSCQPGEHEKIGNMFEELAGNFTQLGVDGNGNASNDFENSKNNLNHTNRDQCEVDFLSHY